MTRARSVFFTAALAGTVYFLCVFSVGFILGVTRTLIVAPQLGALWATMLEVPLILAASWWISRWLLRIFAVPPTVALRVLMGAVAFIWLMAAELVLATTLGRQTAAQHWASYALLPQQIGLVAQILFAVMPMLQTWIRQPAGASEPVDP